MCLGIWLTQLNNKKGNNVMSFMSNLKETLNENSFSVTENGAIGFSRSGSSLLDINFKVTSFRNQSDEAIENAFAQLDAIADSLN